MKNGRGFTLIELLVVISVISIILGVVIPRFKGMQEEANKSKVKAELKTLQTAVESWYINHTPNAYPEATATLCHTYLDGGSPLIVATPLYDPFRAANTEYSYLVSSNGAYYVIFSYGPDGVAGLTDITDNGFLVGTDNDISVTNGTGTFE